MKKIDKTPAEQLSEELKKAEKEMVLASEKLNKDKELTEKKIAQIAKENGYFCGVVLDHKNLLNVLELALKSKEKITIPFKLYLESKK